MNLDDKDHVIKIKAGSDDRVVTISLEDFDHLCSVFERFLDRLEREDIAYAHSARIFEYHN